MLYLANLLAVIARRVHHEDMTDAAKLGLFLTGLGWLSMSSACADECVDDGIGQKFCPGINTETAGEEQGETASETQSTADEGMDGSNCPALDVLLTPQTPTMQIVVDQSGSMQEDFGGMTRWETVTQTLVGGPMSVVGSLQSEIRFGVSLYTGQDMSCPEIQEIGAQLDAQDEISALFAANGPSQETPTGEAFSIIAAGVDADPWPGDKFIVLATDGEPDTCAVPNPDPGTPEAQAARDAVVDAVDAAYQAGIRTYVISVGDDVATTHLQAVANAGAGVAAGEPDATFYQALDEQSLVDAFEDIVAGVRECKLDLDMPLTTELAPSCTVTVNDQPVPYDDPNGWQLDGQLAIELTGAACLQIQEGVVSIEMTCSCEVGG